MLSFFSQTLPKTSYYKLIDWWMLSCMLVLVVSMLMHTYINVVVVVGSEDDGDEHGSRPKSTSSKIAFASSSWFQEAEGKKRRAVKRAKTVNRVAAVSFLAAIVVFQTFFWYFSLTAYFSAQGNNIG